MQVLYICCTADEYEFPIHITTTRVEMARILGVSPTTVSSRCSRKFKDDGAQKGYRLYRVEIEDDE